MFRAKDLDGNEVNGYWFKLKTGKHYIMLEDAKFEDSYPEDDRIYDDCYLEIDPKTLGMKTGVQDKNGDDIYGSFEYEKGKRSEGGDNVSTGFWGGKVVFKDGTFVVVQRGCSDSILGERPMVLEIIGPACDAGDK